jgi:hypothetical protein
MFSIKNTNLIIFDWDDTLFPTYWFNYNKSMKHMQKINLLKKHDTILFFFFTKLIKKKNDIVIISNATHNWINMSKTFLPKTEALLKSKNIKIISTSNNYVKKNITKNSKNIAFFNEVFICNNDNTFINKYNNIISVGDDIHEYYALINLYNFSQNILLKPIKLIKNPNIHVIIKQIIVLHETIDNIINSTKNLDLTFIKHAYHLT